ncbi:MAG: helix-turn-helix transcriptional regulator [Gammaproteobacteria bacterium]|nr:helix-turn-helix transcriptional regulator [Gammaproteobacteria bacterium]
MSKKKKKAPRALAAYNELGTRIMGCFKTQRELAKMLGISQQTVSKKLRGQTAVMLADLEKLSKHLGVPMAAFFTTDTLEESKLFTWLKKNPKILTGLQNLKATRCKLGPVAIYLATFKKR